MGYGTDQPAPPAPEPEQDTQLAAQVGNLAAEVEMMREDQALRDSRNAPSAEPSVAAEEKPPATLLVYRDGHQMEVQDYAILGKTLWVFSDQRTQRVPLADLDLAATQRLNGERGVDFVTPDPQ
jgi:anti-sigma factor ChrR (cupin superfamily)